MDLRQETCKLPGVPFYNSVRTDTYRTEPHMIPTHQLTRPVTTIDDDFGSVDSLVEKYSKQVKHRRKKTCFQIRLNNQ